MRPATAPAIASGRLRRIAVPVMLGLVLGATPALAQLGGLNCTIRPSRVVEVSAALPLVVAQVHVRPGQLVARGTPLVQLDDTQLRAELALVEARAALTAGVDGARTRRDGFERRVARLSEALARNAISAADHESAALELALAEVEVRREEELLTLARLERDRVLAQLQATRVESPVAGIVGEDLVAPGEASLPKPLATIHVVQPLRVEVYVPIGQLPQVAAAPAHAIRVADRAQPVAVQFDYAAPQADLASNTISLFFNLDADDVLPGSRCLMLWGQG